MKTTKAALAERIAANRAGSALSPEEDAKLLAAYLAKPKPGARRATYRSIAQEHGHAVGTVMRAIRRAAAATAVILFLSVDGWGCGGQADTDPEPFGWTCAGITGLSAAESELFESCECAGAEERNADGRGECVEVGT